MKLLRKREYPSGKFTLAFVGYSDETSNTVVELTYNWETHKYDLGNAFGRRALTLRTFTKLAMTCTAGPPRLSARRDRWRTAAPISRLSKTPTATGLSSSI